MVKTRKINSPKSDPKKGDRKIIDKNIREVKPLKKGEYRTASQPYGDMAEDDDEHLDNARKLREGLNNGWLQSMDDGETCRTRDSKKVHIVVSYSIEQGTGINIQGKKEQGEYVWYMTRIFGGEEDTKKPSEKKAATKKGKRK